MLKTPAPQQYERETIISPFRTGRIVSLHEMSLRDMQPCAMRLSRAIRKSLVGAFIAILVALMPGVVFAGQAYFILDARSGEVLASHNPDVRNHPASLTKMMTLYLTFEAIHRGKLSWSSRVPFSKHAASMSPTKLWVKAGSSTSVKEAVLGMIVPSANDAAVAMAEKLGGSENKFATLMNAKARQLGMTQTRFYNASGLPNSGQVTTARDMSTLAVAIMNDFPTEYRLFSTRSFAFRGRTVRGHNNLMYRYKGMDGFKTGFTNASGFNLVSAVHRGNRRVIGVVMGGSTARSRDSLMEKLINRSIAKAENRKTAHLLASVSRSKRPAAAIVADAPRPGQRPAETVHLASASNDVSDMVAAAAPKETSPTRYWMIQVGASPSEAAATRLLDQMRSAHSDILAEAYPFVQSVKDGKITLYRSRYTGFKTQEEATNACEKLRRSKVSCYVPTMEPL
jgi:serine-type D-Ala-D-Ala carboxypeptidase (penicillin-binding protein 5/6)